MRIASLHVYPIKGGRAVDMERARLAMRGLEHDRRWLVTDETGAFLTQRECSDLARLVAAPVDEGLMLRMDGVEGGVHAFISSAAPRRTIRIWKDAVNALEADDAACDWLSSMLGRPARLFFMDAVADRQTSKHWGANVPVSFADGYPLLIVTKASLDALNNELIAGGGSALPMARFRPNIVIEGASPWADDNWRAIRIGDVEIDLVKPCVRCVVTTKDQITGDDTGKEPLRTLAKIRRSAHPDLSGVLFGWNASPRNEGDISVGDVVEVIEERPEGWPLAPVV
ncbi:MAG: MOSC domain-containing protein [Pseudomonadota bacterium]